MKILMLSTDENIFKENSEVRKRMVDYGGLVDELHVIVKSHGLRVKSQELGNVFIYPTNSFWPIFYFWDAYKISSSIIRNWNLEIRNCVITCQDPFETGLVGYLLKSKFKILLQLQIHTDFLSPYFWQESLKNKIRVLVAQWLVKKADGIRVVSERIRSSLCSKFQASSSKIIVLPIFVDVEKIRQVPIKTDLRQKYPGRFIILMASRLTREKNILMALEAMRGLTRNDTRTNTDKVLLLIVGDGPEREMLKAQIISYKLQDNVVIEDWSDDLSSYYKTADLFLLTSNYEGYGRTIIEAAAAGLPVIMTDVGIAWGRVVPVGGISELISAIKLLVGSRELRAKVIEEQNILLKDLVGRDEFLNNIKQSWKSCFS